MTTMDLTVRLAPLLIGMLATLLLAATVIASQAARNLRGEMPDMDRVGYAGAMFAVVMLLVSVVVVHESLLLR